MAKSPTSLTDTPAYKLTNGIYRWFMISLLWLLCSLPVFTIGAATCAALSEFSESENYYQHKLIRSYFQNFKRCFLQSTILWILFLALIGLLVLDITFYQQLSGSSGWGLPVAALVIGNFLLGFSRFGFFRIAAEPRTGFGALLKQSGKMMLMCLPMWAVMVAMDMVVVSTLIQIPYLLILLVLLPGIYANVHCMLIQKFMRRYEQAEEE